MDPRKSRAYQKAMQLVSATLNSQSKISDLLSAAQEKLAGRAQGALRDVLEPLQRAVRMLRAYVAGEYRDISLENIGLLLGALIYLVMPIDALPDFILLLGFTDDAAIIAWTLKTLRDELQRFAEWEAEDPSRRGKVIEGELLDKDETSD